DTFSALDRFRHRSSARRPELVFNRTPSRPLNRGESGLIPEADRDGPARTRTWARRIMSRAFDTIPPVSTGFETVGVGLKRGDKCLVWGDFWGVRLIDSTLALPSTTEARSPAYAS